MNEHNLETIVLGGGCFWCIEAAFSRVNGVVSAISGYAGGDKADPSYEQVCRGKTGHAEVVQLTYNPAVISLEKILGMFFVMHDPTTLNRQGHDVGTQYRSVIFYTDESQKKITEEYINKLAEEKVYNSPIVTEIKALEHFYPAEEYHQHYFEKNPEASYCQLVIAPKLKKFNDTYGQE